MNNDFNYDFKNSTNNPKETPRLHQINATYDSLQDRILLMLNTTHGHEFRFWLTRRYLGLLWQALGHITGTFAVQRAPADPFLRSALSEFAEAQALSRADTQQSFTSGGYFPLGREPVLLSRITVTPLQQDQQTLRLTPEKGEGINLALNEDLAHILTNLLRQTAISAEWGLDLPLGLQASSAFGSIRPPTLH
jgi:hypothetical protein